MNRAITFPAILFVGAGIPACWESDTGNTDTSGAADSETDDETDSIGSDSGGLNEVCLPGYDANAPTLRFRAIVPTEPGPLSDFASGTQSSVDDETLNYLLMMDDLSVGDTVTGTFGVGEKTDAENTFRFTAESSQMTFEMDGEHFASQGAVETVLVVPLNDVVLSVPLQEVTLDGTFATTAHCSVGLQTAEGPPTEWTAGGKMSGLLSVSDAKAVSVTVAGRTFTLCAYLAYGVSAALPGADTECEADVSTWTYPPEDTLSGGEAAWRVSADFAATAVYIE